MTPTGIERQDAPFTHCVIGQVFPTDTAVRLQERLAARDDWALKNEPRNRVRTCHWRHDELPDDIAAVLTDEIAAGVINHALRFTTEPTQGAYVAPASHYASTASNPDDPKLPPMGLRVRLKADYDLSKAPPQSKVILTALKKYGMILADNGTGWFVSGAKDPGWDDDDLEYIKSVPGDAFEAIETGSLTGNCY